MTSVLAFDLGTGGCKASIWRDDAVTLGEAVVEYSTSHPGHGLNEQRPTDWWDAVVATAGALRNKQPEAYRSVKAVVLSGHSLGALPLDSERRLLQTYTPIWSDTRGEVEAAEVFESAATGSLTEDEWYNLTGNGFSRGLYPVFKLRWLRGNEPAVFEKMTTVIGSKDYINLRLTGEVATDHSYASGNGAYDLVNERYNSRILAAVGLDASIFPAPVEAHDQVGTLTSEAAEALGLPTDVRVFAGGVDNSCMAAGSKLTSTGRAYASLGSSSWLTVTGEQPILDAASRPFVFRHLVPGQFISALSTFSTGTSFDWARETLFGDDSNIGAEPFIDEAMTASIGADGVSFLPALAGGTPLEGGSAARGGLLGVSLGTTRADIARAVLEGISLAIASRLEVLEQLTPVERPVLITGGGSRSEAWNNLYAAAMDAALYRTTVSQDAATLGAAAAAFVGLGVWDSYADADQAHSYVDSFVPNTDDVEAYRSVRQRFDLDTRLNAYRSNR